MRLYKQIANTLKVPVVHAGRFGYSWVLLTLWFAGNIVGWTLIVSETLRVFSIKALLPLMLIDGGLMLLGAVISGFLLPKTTRQHLLQILGIGAGIFIICSFFFSNYIWSLGLLLVAKSVFWHQGLIQVHREIESLFSPQQARKLLAKIDTAHVVGALFGALLFLILLNVAPTKSGALLWLGVIGLWQINLSTRDEIVAYLPEFLRHQHHPQATKNAYQSPLAEIKALYQKFPSISGLSFLLVLGIMLLSGVEFLFLEHLYEYAGSKPPKPTDNLQANLINIENIAQEAKNIGQKIQKATESYFTHHSLAHDLSVIHLLWAVFAIGIQMSFGSKVLTKFGIIKTLYFGILWLIAPIALAIGLPVVGYGGMRVGQHAGLGFFATPLNIFFYSLPDAGRESLRIFFYGVLYPLAWILGLGLAFFAGKTGLFAVGVTLLVLGLAYSKKIQKNYTKMSLQVLKKDISSHQQLHHLEVLGENGHQHIVEDIVDFLKKPKRSQNVKMKAIKVLTKHLKPQNLSGVLELLPHPAFAEQSLQVALLLAIRETENRPHLWQKHQWTYYNAKKMLEKLSESPEFEIRKRALESLFHILPHQDSARLFLDKLQKADEKTGETLLHILKKSEDKTLRLYIRPYLDEGNLRTQTYAIIALWKIENQEILRIKIQEWIESEHSERIISALYAIGEVQDGTMISEVQRLSQNTDPEVQMHAIITLGKLQNRHAASELAEFIVNQTNKNLASNAKHMASRWSDDLQEDLLEEIEERVSHKVHHLNLTTNLDLNELSGDVLGELRHLYAMAEQHEHAERIHKAMGGEK